MKGFGLSTLPFDLPLVMASWAGGTLDTSDHKKPSFIELTKNDDDGTISIRVAEDKRKHLVLNSHQQCFFDDHQDALKFEAKVSPAGRLVFEEYLTRHVLEIDFQGRTKLVVCRNKYSKETQSWLILQRTKLDDSVTSSSTFDPLNFVGTDEDEDCERRHVIMHLLGSGKSTEVVGEILTLMYGSTAPRGNDVVSNGIGAERRQQTLKFLEAVKSATEVGAILALLYGTKRGGNNEGF